MATDTFTEYLENKRRGFISPSDIKGVKTPEQFFYKIMHPDTEHHDYFDIGTAVHTLILEPERWEKTVYAAENAEFPEPDRINKDGSLSMVGKNGSYMKELRLIHPDKVVLQEAYWRKVEAMAEKVKNLPDIHRILDFNNSVVEQSLYVKYVFRNDELAGIEPVDPKDVKRKKDEILVATRPDLVCSKGWYLDLKTTQSAAPEDFARSAANLEYDIQGAMGCDIASVCTGWTVENFLILAVEKEEPFGVALYDMVAEDLNIARQVYVRRLNVIRRAMNTGKYPGYEVYANNDYGVLTLSMPAWHKQKLLEASF